MKVCLRYNKKLFPKSDYDVVVKFLKFLQKQIPISKDIEISFVESRTGSMTTGVRKPNGEIDILVGNRLLIDILRTISHEWVHEYQHQVLNLSQKKSKIKDIGGPEENMANILSGIFLKKFQKKFPNLEPKMYGE